MHSRLTAILALSFALCACTRVDERPAVRQDELFEITLTCEERGVSGNDSTRTSIEGVTPTWNAGDEIWLSDGKNTCKAVVPAEYQGLSYTKLVYSGLSQDSSIYALYPYDEDAYVSGGKIITTHPVIQDGTFGSCQTMMGVASKSEKNILLHNVSAVMEFYHNREDLIRMQLSNHCGEHLSGNSCNVVMDFDGTGYKYFSVLPSTLSAGSRFTFVTGDRRLGHISLTRDNRLSAGYLYDMGSIDDRIVLDASPATNLSASESANCYMISKAGSYCFNAVKGNGKESVGEVAFADVLWETTNTSSAPAVHSIVTDCIASGNMVFFRIPEGFKDGNALLAAFDRDGNVLWSWHLWIVSGGVRDHAFSDESMTFSDAVLQDRNLGALTAAAGKATSGGLLYQYGRKDPFFGSAGLTTRVNYGFASNYFSQLPLTEASTASSGTLEYTSRNPQTFIFKGDNGHWLYNKDVTMWNASKKTVYDPCPPGYHIPEGAALDGLDLNNTVWSATNAGRSITIDGQNIWLPSSGFLSSSTAAFQYVGKLGFYWYDINSSSQKHNCWQVSDTAVGNANKTMVYALAYSVRCQKKLSADDRQTLTVALSTTSDGEYVKGPVFYGLEISGKFNWGDGSSLKLAASDTSLVYRHNYVSAGNYSQSALGFGIDSVRFPSIGSVKTIDLSGL